MAGRAVVVGRCRLLGPALLAILVLLLAFGAPAVASDDLRSVVYDYDGVGAATEPVLQAPPRPARDHDVLEDRRAMASLRSEYDHLAKLARASKRPGEYRSAPRPTTFLDDATAPVGRRRSPIDIAPGTNSPATIGSRQYTGHALDRMQGRGIMPSAVDDAIRNIAPVRGADGSIVHYSQTNNISVVLNANGSVRTVSYGQFKPR